MKLDQFSDQLAKVIFVICGLVWAMNYTKFDDPIHGGVIKGCIYYFKIAVALAVAAIPEGLPAVITTCLALGTRKMAQNNCIVRRLPSVETLGCTSTICSDKTGTLTKNLMCAVKFGIIGKYWQDVAEFDVEESEYSPLSNIKNMSRDNYKSNKNLEKMALVCSMNNRARIVNEEGAFKNQGEPTEAALKVFAEKLAKLGSDKNHDLKKSPNAHGDEFDKSYNRVATLDFSSERKTMSTVVAGTNGQNWVLLKGAPERVMEKCNGYYKDNGDQANFNNQIEKQHILDKITKCSSQGLRVLAIAMATDGGNMKHINKSNLDKELDDPSKYPQLESNVNFLGYVCIMDPIREEVPEAIRMCHYAGVNVIMITGDSKETANAIAKQLSIIKPGQDEKASCLTGAEFESLSMDDKKKRLSGRSGKVFSRVEPRHKRELVKILIDMGEVVAMTGDGVNDAPALK